MPVLVLLPVTFFGTLLLAFVGIGRHGLRQSFVYAATAYTLCLVCVTEIFSIWNLLQLEPLLGFWTGCTVLSIFSLSRYGDWGATRQAVRGASKMFRASGFEISAIVVILASVLLIAVVAPPNNWESMAYRMTRVVMWMQQGSIAHYPTPDIAQLYHPPLSEWNILHFQILSGGDRFANTVHWFALTGCGVLASLIAKELKQPVSVQVLATVIAVTLPMGLVQGSSSQGNLVVAFWLLTFVVFSLQYFRRPTSVGLMYCGCAFGFTLLSKGTAYAIAPAVAAPLWLCGIVRTTGHRRRAKLVCAGGGVVLVALVVNGGHFIRNWDLFGHLLGPMDQPVHSHLNEQISVFVLMANSVRNAALHWGVPNETLNDLTLDTVRRVFGEIIDDIPGSTLEPSLFEVGIRFSLSEYHTGNFLHFWFLAASLPGILLFRRRGRFDPRTVGLALSGVLGALAFCGILQWQQWNSRYHTPLFMLGAPCGAIFVARLLSRGDIREKARPSASSVRSLLHLIVSRRRSMVAGTFVVMSIPWAISNDVRPLYPLGIWQTNSSSTPSIFSQSRTYMYFNSSPGLRRTYHQAIDFLATQNPKRVGLYGGKEYWYPISALLKDRLGKRPRLEYVSVSNHTNKLRAVDSAPPFVFYRKGPLSTLEGDRYHVVWKSPSVILLANSKSRQGSVEEWKRIINVRNLLIRSHLEVYLDRNENRLVYVKDRCQPAAMLSGQSHQLPAESRIFLHVDPADVDDLPDHRKRYGFDNLDFHFNDYRIDIPPGKRCISVCHLPAYAVVGIRTGQSTDGRRLWEVEVSFDE